MDSAGRRRFMRRFVMALPLITAVIVGLRLQSASADVCEGLDIAACIEIIMHPPTTTIAPVTTTTTLAPEVTSTIPEITTTSTPPEESCETPMVEPEGGEPTSSDS
ncbi:hypothetical protein KBC99_02945 [Candidatus Saccharibacteria bacterium]|nr:hypothetical protein [Candidatus Saccharibacteria bacterium]